MTFHLEAGVPGNFKGYIEPVFLIINFRMLERKCLVLCISMLCDYISFANIELLVYKSINYSND